MQVRQRGETSRGEVLSWLNGCSASMFCRKGVEQLGSTSRSPYAPLGGAGSCRPSVASAPAAAMLPSCSQAAMPSLMCCCFTPRRGRLCYRACMGCDGRTRSRLPAGAQREAGRRALWVIKCEINASRTLFFAFPLPTGLPRIAVCHGKARLRALRVCPDHTCWTIPIAN